MLRDNLAVKLEALKYIDENGYERSTTANQLRRIIKRGGMGEIAVRDYVEQIRTINDWMETRCPNTNWGNAARDVWNHEEISISDNNSNRDDLPMLCSIIDIVLNQEPARAREREEREAELERERAAAQQKLEDPSNKWAGELGEKVTFTIMEDQFIRAFEGRTYYAPTTYLHHFIGTDELIYSGLLYDDSDIVTGDKITATIKSQDIDNKTGKRITRLTRMKKIGHEDNPRPLRSIHKLRFGN